MSAEPGSIVAGSSPLGRAIDAAPWSGRQKWTALVAGLAIATDGIDNQLLALAAPEIARDWHVSMASFAPALSASLVGMMVGNALGGSLGDRLGAKRVSLASVGLFGIFTMLIGLLHGPALLVVFRLIAGLGLGAAMPNLSALVAEVTPQRRRTLVVTLTTLCIPLGAVLAGLFASAAFNGFGWRMLFIWAGAAPLLILVVAAFLLPESPHYLARRKSRTRQFDATLRGMGLDPVVALGSAVDQAPAAAKSAYRMVLAKPWRRNTLLAWCASVANMLGLYSLLTWLPATLVKSGYTPSTASLGMSVLNIGGMAGALLAAAAVNRIGSRVTLSVMALGAAVAGLVLVASHLGPQFPVGALFAILLVLGGFGGGLNVAIFPMVLNLYPPVAKAGGLGLTLGVGRIGAAVSPFIAVAVSAHGSAGFFATYAGAMVAAALAIALISVQIAPKAAAPLR